LVNEGFAINMASWHRAALGEPYAPPAVRLADARPHDLAVGTAVGIKEDSTVKLLILLRK
jgi:hypothetical protein